MNDSNPQASPDVVEREIAIEQAHVDKVYVQLDKETDSARGVAAEGLSKHQTDRADWHREEDGTALFERDAFAYQAARRLKVLESQHEGLVFGRLDFSDDTETRYIGRIGVRDDDYEPIVIDWRAPAAEAFYRATDLEPMGVARRRVLQSRDAEVIGLEDNLLDESAAGDLVIVGEGALMASLKRARGTQMRDIVATIQAEQDEAIRAPYQGVTVITGGPGTGKTVVALHRAAFLLYTYRKRLQQGGVLVVGPSDLFMRYIDRVLPSLGEDSVTLKSMGDLASDVLDFGSQRVEDRVAGLIKGSLKMVPVLRRAMTEPLSPGLVLRVSVKGEILSLDESQLAPIRRQILGRYKHNLAISAVETALLNELWDSLSPEIKAVLDLDRELFDELVTSQASWQMFLNAWWPQLDPEHILSRLADPEFLRKVSHNELSSDEQQVLMESFAHARGYVPHSGSEKPHWSISDIALLDELADMIGPFQGDDDLDTSVTFSSGGDVDELVTIADRLSVNREVTDDIIATYSHVLVDESQDVTPMQWRMLRRRGPQASWTLVGDVAQSAYPDTEQTSQAIKDLVGRGRYREFTLTKNYRSPAEVMNLAAQVIRPIAPNAKLPDAVRETGVQPRLLAIPPKDLTRTLKLQLDELGQIVDGSIAVITAPNRFESIRDTVRTMALDPGVAKRVSVVTAMQAKGLEYDAVIVVSPDDIVEQSAGGVRVLYVALTRPTRRLVTIDLTPDGSAGAWRESVELPPNGSE